MLGEKLNCFEIQTHFQKCGRVQGNKSQLSQGSKPQVATTLGVEAPMMSKIFGSRLILIGPYLVH
jgi:hypothetical protein